MVAGIQLLSLTLGQVAELAKENGIDPSSELKKIIDAQIPRLAD